MIALQAFMDAVRENVSRITHYEHGGDGSGGGCDCIGLIIGAVKLAGGKWPGTHGSNWAARNAMDGLSHISPIADMYAGQIVFKAKSPGEEGYDLPAAYDDSPDRLDYYHVGVVTGIDPLCIIHCTSVPGGIQVDSKLGLWRYGGRLKYVDYQDSAPGPEEPLYIATVTAISGKTVNLRSGPGTTNKIIAQVPIGETVEVYDVLDGWSQVEWNGKSGYMMTEFLQDFGALPDNGPEYMTVRLEDLENALNAVDALRLLLQKMLRGD